jgi:hypothetical protein
VNTEPIELVGNVALQDFGGGDIDLISVYDLKDINQNFCQWSGETW